MSQARSNDRLHFCIVWLILILWLNRFPHKYDFKLRKYTKSNGVKSVEDGWLIAHWNPNTSLSSIVFLVVWHGVLSWCNTPFSIWAANSGRFFHNACMISRRTVYNKTTHHFLNVNDKFNKSFKHSIEFNERSRVTYSRVCCAVYLPSNLSYGASLVTVDGVRRRFLCSASLIFRPPTRCITRTTVA